MKQHFERRAIGFARRTGIVLLNLLFNHRLFYRALGWLNERFDFLASVFVAYPASAKYAKYYFSPSINQKFEWSPALCALLHQNGKWTLGFGISSLEQDFHDSSNEEDLQALVERTEHIRKAVGADHKTFSGILPGVLHRRGILEDATEAKVTARVVLKAIQLVEQKENLSSDVPLIVLGGRGYIGSRLVQALPNQRLHSVDKSRSDDTWPTYLKGQRALLINVANRTALQQYLGRVWSGLTLLNEVYPEPKPQEIEAFTQHGNSAYHVVGLKASAYPKFPKAYAGGIPCCAGRLTDDIEPLIRKLN